MEFQWSKIAHYRKYQKGLPSSIWKVPIITDNIKFIVNIVKIKNGDKILDIGAHNRSLQSQFKNYGRQITYKSMDIDKSLPHDYYSLDEIKDKFDVIICLEVIEHMPAEAGVKMLTKIYKLLRPGGRFIMSTPNIYHPVVFRTDPTHITPYGYQDLAGILLSLKFEGLRIYRISSFKPGIRRLIKGRLTKYFKIDFAKRILLTCEKA